MNSRNELNYELAAQALWLHDDNYGEAERWINSLNPPEDILEGIMQHLSDFLEDDMP